MEFPRGSVKNLCCILNAKVKCNLCGETRCNDHGPDNHFLRHDSYGRYPIFISVEDAWRTHNLVWTKESGWTL